MGEKPYADRSKSCSDNTRVTPQSTTSLTLSMLHNTNATAIMNTILHRCAMPTPGVSAAVVAAVAAAVVGLSGAAPFAAPPEAPLLEPLTEVWLPSAGVLPDGWASTLTPTTPEDEVGSSGSLGKAGGPALGVCHLLLLRDDLKAVGKPLGRAQLLESAPACPQMLPDPNARGVQGLGCLVCVARSLWS